MIAMKNVIMGKNIRNVNAGVIKMDEMPEHIKKIKHKLTNKEWEQLDAYWTLTNMEEDLDLGKKEKEAYGL